MVLESTMICIDNSDYMRNGDFTPTRMQAQQDAANLVLQCKLRSNPENGVGVLSMADKVDVLCTMTQDNGKLFMKLHQIQPRGESNFIAGIRVAQLALKHRQNNASKMRIVLFVGSPMFTTNEADLVKLAKKLKKEKVSVDVICFGEPDSENADKMGKFVETLNGRDTTTPGDSHLVVVDSTGNTTLPEALLSSAVCRGEDGNAPPVAMAAAGGAAGELFDPADDPELAMALRVSLEEQRQRQETEARRVTEQSGEDVGTTPTDAVAPASEAQAPAAAQEQMDVAMMSEDEQLAWALRMSMNENAEADNQPAPSKTPEPSETAPAPSTPGAPKAEAKAKTDTSEPMDTASGDDLGELINDPDVLQQLVSNLPNVDANSDAVQRAVHGQQDKDKDKKPKDEQKKNDESKK